MDPLTSAIPSQKPSTAPVTTPLTPATGGSLSNLAASRLFAGHTVASETDETFKHLFLSYLQNAYDKQAKIHLRAFCQEHPPRQLVFPVGPQLSSQQLVRFFETFDVSQCTAVDLSGCKHVSDAVAKAVVDHCTQLESLYLFKADKLWSSQQYLRYAIRMSCRIAALASLGLAYGIFCTLINRKEESEEIILTWDIRKYVNALFSSLLYLWMINTEVLPIVEKYAVECTGKDREALTFEGLAYLTTRLSQPARATRLQNLQVVCASFRPAEWRALKTLLAHAANLKNLSIETKQLPHTPMDVIWDDEESWEACKHLKTLTVYHDADLIFGFEPTPEPALS